MSNWKWTIRRTLIRAICGRTASSNARESNSTQRILVMRPDHLGDLLFATPSLELLRKAFPQAHITGAVGPWGKAMWEDNPNLDALIAIPFPGIAAKTGRPLAPYRLLDGTTKQLARERYDMGVALRFDHWWGAALLWAAGIPTRWGYDTPGMGEWLTNAVPYTYGRHEVEQDLHIIQAVVRTGHTTPLQIDRAKGAPPLRPPSPEPPPEGALGGWQTAPRRAVIHPGTGAVNKLWTIAGWAEVADKLAEEGWSVALTGAPDERELTGAIVAAAGSKPIDAAGKTANLRQLAWALDKADMVLGVDSGPLHIASALGKPTLHLYGPSDETLWGPWGDPRKHIALRAPSTRPTMSLDVGAPGLEGGPEMRAITVGMVMGEVRRLISIEDVDAK